MQLNLKLVVKQVLFLLLLITSTHILIGQNLIQNGDLEDTIPRPFGYKFAKFWDIPTDGSPDYMSGFHNGFDNRFGVPMNFAGYQNGKLGISYIGFQSVSFNSLDRREYIQNKLRYDLKKDSIYCLQFYISLGDSSRLATKNSLGVFFSNFRIDSNITNNLSLTPQLILDSNYIVDKKQWILVEGIYKAEGGEEYITIGNFNSDIETDTIQLNNGGNEPFMNSAYYYVDNFFLEAAIAYLKILP